MRASLNWPRVTKSAVAVPPMGDALAVVDITCDACECEYEDLPCNMGPKVNPVDGLIHFTSHCPVCRNVNQVTPAHKRRVIVTDRPIF